MVWPITFRLAHSFDAFIKEKIKKKKSDFGECMSLEKKEGNDAVARHNKNMEILIVLKLAVGANDLKPNEEYSKYVRTRARAQMANGNS